MLYKEKISLFTNFKSTSTKRKIVFASSILLGVLMYYAAISKLSSYSVFVMQLDKSPLIPDSLTKFTAIFIPSIELLIALGLLFDKFRSLSLLSGFALMFGFSVYLIVLNTFYIDVPCSCGGILGKMSYEAHIVFNIIFTIISYIGYQKTQD
jgi:hypothetical protein